MIINLTPHAILLRKVDGSVMELPRSERPARVQTRDMIMGDVDGLAVHKMSFEDEIQDLPDPEPDVVYVTSLLVAQRARQLGRADVFAPGPALRDDEGRVIGADGLSAP